MPLLGRQPEVPDFLSSYLSTLPIRPKAILLVTAHWRTRTPHVRSNPTPGMLYDYGGFPREMYDLPTPAVGSPELAARVAELCADAGIPCTQDTTRDFDHGCFVPLLCIGAPGTLPPVVSFSVLESEDGAESVRVGAALAPLRDDGVLILGSGSTFHNFEHLFAEGRKRAKGEAMSRDFDKWLSETLTGNMEKNERMEQIAKWHKAPGARDCQPNGKADHLLPTFVAFGASGARGKLVGEDFYKRKEVMTGLKTGQYQFD